MRQRAWKGGGKSSAEPQRWRGPAVGRAEALEGQECRLEAGWWVVGSQALRALNADSSIKSFP